MLWACVALILCWVAAATAPPKWSITILFTLTVILTICFEVARDKIALLGQRVSVVEVQKFEAPEERIEMLEKKLPPMICAVIFGDDVLGGERCTAAMWEAIRIPEAI